MALGNQYGPRWHPRLQFSEQPLGATGVTDVNTGSLCHFRVSDEDMVCGHNPRPNITLNLGVQQATYLSLFLTILTS